MLEGVYVLRVLTSQGMSGLCIVFLQNRRAVNNTNNNSQSAARARDVVQVSVASDGGSEWTSSVRLHDRAYRSQE